MNKHTAALIALFAGWILTADTADAITYKDIAGQWCGDVTDYVFTPSTLTVKFHDGRPEKPAEEAVVAESCPLQAGRRLTLSAKAIVTAAAYPA